MQVRAECRVQLAEQDNLQLLPLPMDSVSCSRGCRAGILYSGLLPRGQERIFPKGTFFTSLRSLLYLHCLCCTQQPLSSVCTDLTSTIVIINLRPA